MARAELMRHAPFTEPNKPWDIAPALSLRLNEKAVLVIVVAPE